MRKVIMAAVLTAGAAFGQTFVQHLKCDLETATGASLPPRTISQGTTPLWSVDLYRAGQPVAAVTDGTTRAVVVLAQSATGSVFAAVTNTATTANGYTVQWPVVGTNSGGSGAAPWWYMVLLQTTGGKTYWTGSGRLTIEPSNWSGLDGLGWGASPNNYAILIAQEAAIRSNSDVSLNTRIDNLIVGAGLSTQDCQNIVSGILPTATVAYATSAGTATTALAVAWGGITGRPAVWPGTATDSVARIVASAANDAANAANVTGSVHTAQIATQEAFRVASTVNYATNAGNALTVNGLTSTQIMEQATNSFAQRSWVIGFSNAPTTYNSADATLDVAMPDGTVGQMFEELWMPIKNTSGVPLTNGVCVRIEDASGALSGVRLVSCTDTWDQVLGTIGLSTMTTATPINGDGKITTFGNVNDLNTLAFVEGSNLWLSATPGQLTMEKPTAAGCKQVLIGKCLRSHANVGRISVGVRIIPRPDDIGAVPTNDARYLAALTNAAAFEAAGSIAIHNTNELAHLTLASIVYVTNQLAGYVPTNNARYLAALTNGGATINGAPITNGAAITVAAALPAGAIVATNQGVAGQSFFFSQGAPSGVSTGYFATAAGSGDMLKSEYDAGGAKQVAFTNDPRIVNAITSTPAVVAAATNVIGAQSNKLFYALEGAQTVAATTNLYTLTYTAPAVWSNNQIELLPYSTTNYGAAVTGTVTITMKSNVYLASIGGTWNYKLADGITPQFPVTVNADYMSSTTAVLSATCSTNPADAVSSYYAYFSNLVVYTYDRTGMQPLQYTNDAAGIVARVDPLPAGNTDQRRVVNQESLTAAIAAAAPGISIGAWGYTPTGARQPSVSTLTIDKPLVQQGTMAYLQSGDYFAASYQGGDWYNVTTGSCWRLGPGGRVAFEVCSTNRMLFIQAFSVATNWATLDVATNWVTGTPYAEFCADLGNPQWLACPSAIVTSNADYWRIQCPATASQRFYRAVSPGGANAINSYYQHHFFGGVSGIGAADVGAVATNDARYLAALTNATAFDPAGTAGVVQANLTTHTNLTLSAGAHGGVVPINILSNAPNTTWKIYGTQVVETANNWAIIDATQPLRLYSWNGSTEEQGGRFVRTDTKSLFIDFDARTFHSMNGDKRLAVSGSISSELELYDPYNQLAMKGKSSGGGGFEFLKPITLGGVELNTFFGIAGAIAHTNRTDNPHSVTAAQVGALSTNGGTVIGSVYTTVTNSPSDNEFARAGWVRGLISEGQQWYFTQAVTNGFGEKTPNFVALSRDLPALAFTNVIASPVPSSTYIAGGVITGTLSAVNSPITLDVWVSRVGGSGSSVIPLYAEVYYIYNNTTNHLGDWSVGPWSVTGTDPQNHQFVVSFNEPTVTGQVRIVSYLKTGTVSGPAAGLWIWGGNGYSSHMDIEGTVGETTGEVGARLTTHTNQTLAAGAHPDSAAIVASTASNTAFRLASTVATATNATFATVVTGSQSNTIANALTNGGAVAVAATNAQARVAILETNSVPPARTITIDGVTYDLSANRSWTTAAGGVTLAQCTNVAQTVVSASHTPTYYLTNTVVVSNSLDFAIPIAGNNIRVRWMAMFLSATNEAATSKRAMFSMFTRSDRLCDSAIYSDTNQLYWAAPSTSAQAAGAATGTVADASGVVPYDRYAVGNGTQWDFLTATQTTATVIFYACTNKYSTTATADTKISHANYLTPVFYDDDSGQSNAWCRFAWATPYTGTVTTIMRYSK